MDQSTPDPPKSAPAAPTAARGTARDRRIDARLRLLAGADEHVVAWTRGWVSREVRGHFLFAARTLDFVVLTERSVLLYSTGFFTRRPRRPVYASRIDRLFVVEDPVRRIRRLRLSSRQAHPLWIEMRRSERTREFADGLIARARGNES